MRSIAFRRHQTASHMQRRLKEDRNQHYDNLSCPCWSDPKAMAVFKEQPKLCSCWMCGNPRRFGKLTIQEKKLPRVTFGKIEDEPDWRDVEDGESEDAPASEALIAVLGFDPDDNDPAI